MAAIWRVEMLGTLQARADFGVVARFRTRRVGLLLAYLAYYAERSHSREELADMLWSELDPDLARRNLRQALSSLRRHVEPPAIPSGAVLISKQSKVSLSPELISTDVAEFNLVVKAGLAETDNRQRIDKLKQALELYKGDLLPGYYEEWVQQERLRLEDTFVSALQNLVQAFEVEGQIDEAIHYVRLALAKDHLQEDLHATLMRLYLASSRPGSALQHFQTWKERLAADLREEPGPKLRALAEQAKREGAASSTSKTAGAVKTAAANAAVTASSLRLPVQLTQFFGRQSDVDRVVNEITHGARLVSLLGPAGTGKTRLSIEAAKALATLGWNVWFVPLADINDGQDVLNAAIQAMRVPREGADPIESLRPHLAGPNNLLIFDNLEHILEAAVPGIESLIHQISSVSVVVTSRHSLKIGGEKELHLAALPVPDLETNSLVEIAQIPSVQLFVNRAQAVLPDFQITPNNTKAISAICSKLDGLPLALEIAAGLANAFTPSQLLQNLDNRLEILRSRRRDLSERHRSLRAAIDYSYDLLDEALQKLFVSLSVFRGGFTIDAAANVCFEKEETKTGECLRMILDLQERSLLKSDESVEGSPARFRLLESFREYGAETLGEDGLLVFRGRHAAYFLNTPRDQVDLDRDNRLAALQFYFDRRQIHECVHLLKSLQTFSYTGRHMIQALSALKEASQADPVDRLALLGMLSKAHIYASEYEESYQSCMSALRIAEDLGLQEQIKIFRQESAVPLSYLGRRQEAIATTEECLRAGLETEDWMAVEIAYMNIGTNRWALGEFEPALEAFHKALQMVAKFPGTTPGWNVYYNLARVNLDAGNLDDGFQFASEGLRTAQTPGDEFGTSMCLSLISIYHREKRNLAAALATSHEALVRRRKAGFVHWTLNAIQAHATVLIAMGCFRDATTLLAASRSVTKLKREVDERAFAADLEAVKANLSESAFEQAWAQGLAMNLEEAFRLAVSHR